MRSEPYNGDLRELVGETTIRGDNPTYILCPVHEDNNRPSLAVYADHAHCYTCGAHLSRVQLSAAYSQQDKWQAKLRRQLGVVKRVASPTVKVDVPALVRSSQVLLNTLPDKRQYLHDRGLDDFTIGKYILGYAGSAYVLPLFEEPLTVRFRRDDAVTTDGSKYWGLRGQNETRVYPYAPRERSIVLTEGEFDALLLRQYGLNAYSFTNGANALPSDEQLRHWLEGRTVFLMRDQDGPGRKATHDLFLRLYRMPLHELEMRWDAEEDGKDVTEVWQRNREKFLQLIRDVQSVEEPVV